MTMIDIRLNDKCPICGTRVETICIDIAYGKVDAINVACGKCGARFAIDRDDDGVIDIWNELSGRKNDYE